VYEAVRRRLAEELGLDPGAELRQAQAAVLRFDNASPLNGNSGAGPAPAPGRRSSLTSDRCCHVAHRTRHRHQLRHRPPAAR
jgi:hypothetical protein